MGTVCIFAANENCSRRRTGYFYGKPSQFIQLAEAGQVLDSTGQKCLDNLSEVDKAMVSVGEKVYGVPVDRSIAGVFYKDMFDEYQLRAPTTLSEFNEIIRTFEEQGVVPFVRAYKDNIYPRVDFDSSFGSMVAKKRMRSFMKRYKMERKNSAIIQCLNYRLTFTPPDYPLKEMTILEQMLREPTNYSPAGSILCALPVPGQLET